MNINELTIGQLKEIQSLAPCGKRPKRARPALSGRAVVVVDRGWIFAGDISRTADGYVRIANAVHVFRWESMGFAKMLEDWKSAKVDLRPCAAVEVPEDAIVFRVPVGDEWGKR